MKKVKNMLRMRQSVSYYGHLPQIIFTSKLTVAPAINTFQLTIHIIYSLEKNELIQIPLILIIFEV